MRADTPHMKDKLRRLLAAIPGRSREVQYLVIVNTARGPVAVPGPKQKLR